MSSLHKTLMGVVKDAVRLSLRQRWTVAVGAVLAVVLFASCGSARPPVEADFFVSPVGNDRNPGTYDKPFLTLEHAREAVRNVIRSELKEDITVLLRGGMYYQDKTVRFGPEDSGTETCSITYAAYPGERVSLIGGVPIDEWERAGEHIWVASIPDGNVPMFRVEVSDNETREGSALLGAGVRTMQLSENGTRLELARHPNTGYLTTDRPEGNASPRTLTCRQGEIDLAEINPSFASVYIWAGHDWFSQLLPVAAVDSEKRRIVVGMDFNYSLRRVGGDRYFIRNVRAFLDSPGEYFVDPAERKVYVWPTVGTAPENGYVVSAAGSIISIGGDSPENLVRNLHFRDLDLSLANDDVVRITGAENCSIRNCLIEQSHECGIQLRHHARYITIAGNLIRHIGGYALLFEGVPYTAPGCPDLNNHNTVENNHIHHTGEFYGHGYGIMLYQSGDNRVLHNEMHDLPRFAVMIKTMRYQILKEHFGGLAWGEQWQYQHSRNNLIAYNRLHHTMQDSEDAGAIDSWGAGRGNIYDHNLVYETGNDECRWMGGIYIDDATDYYTVSNNIIWGVNGTEGNQVLYAKGVSGTITNNILICPPARTNAIRTFFMAGERNDSLEFTHNIIYFEGEQGVVHDFPNWSEDRIAVSDYNVYWKPKGDFVWSTGKLALTFDEWRRLLDGKYDQHSVFADPLFVDLENRDFRLKPESPALKLGFQPIDTSEIGLRNDFPARFGRD